MPTPCPSRLKELIALANLEPDSEARKHLQAIARAFRANRQGEADAPSIQLEIRQIITVALGDGRVETSRGELELALDEIEPPDKIDLIRECPSPKCLEIFWAGRANKEACKKHAGAWSKSEWRRRVEEKKAEKARIRASRAEIRKKTPFELSLTTATILDAVVEQNHYFDSIDQFCYMKLSKYGYGRFKGVYRTPNVISGLEKLAEHDYLQADEIEAGGFYYTLKNKARELLREADRKDCYIRDLVKSHEPPTH